MVLPIYVYGEAILRQPTLSVEALTPDVEALVRSMIDTMHGADGVGLAAPQVGRRERIFVVDVTPFAQRGTLEEDVPPQPMTFINPEIVWESDEETDFEEGCLSIPDLREIVWRPERVRLRYRDEAFEPREIEIAGMLARVIQHEVDHLEGVLFVDHLSPFRRRMLQRRLRNMARGDVSAEYPIHAATAD